MQITLYHGSPETVAAPSLEKGRPRNDYGRGFYCTQDLDLAREWACFTPEQDGYVNEYRLEADGLKLIDLSAEPYTSLNWMAILLEHRRLNNLSVRLEDTRMEFVSKYRVDLKGADIVRGPRADDTYAAFAKHFLTGQLSVPELERAMELGNLGEQVVLVSKRAFEHLEFVGAEQVEARLWGARRVQRDREAAAVFKEMLASRELARKPTINELVDE